MRRHSTVIQEMRLGNYCQEKERRNEGERKDFSEKRSSTLGIKE